MATLFLHEWLVEARGPMLRTFGILETPKQKQDIFNKVAINQLLNQFMEQHEPRKPKEQNEAPRKKTNHELLLSRVRDEVYRDFYNRY